MIKKVLISGYRIFKKIELLPDSRMNVFVGDNESGKSTLLEAIILCLTGRISGVSADEAKSPSWFNNEVVAEFFESRAKGERVPPPVINIEVFLDEIEGLARLSGAHHSERPVRDRTGVSLTLEPNPEYSSELEACLGTGTRLIPVEFYSVSWRSFADEPLLARPKELRVAVVDSRTIRSTNAIDYHMRQILSDQLKPQDRASIATAYRLAKEGVTRDHLANINERLGDFGKGINDEPLSLAMDQSLRTSWESQLTPQVDQTPLALCGQGQQAVIKVGIAMANTAGNAPIVMLEEPENHLSHTSLNRLLHRVEESMDERQLFVATHSSFVLNRLGLDRLRFVSRGHISSMANVSRETSAYFRKLAGHDTLRLVLARRIVLVEGPSDELIFERFYYEQYGHRPIDDGVDIFSMGGLSVARHLELLSALPKPSVLVLDNDNRSEAEVREQYDQYLKDGLCRLFVSSKEDGPTLEPQIVKVNGVDLIRAVVAVDERVDLVDWMTSHKTEAAVRIYDYKGALAAPAYIQGAIEASNAR